MISDSHTDFITELKRIKEKERYVQKLKQQKVGIINCAVFTSQQKLTIEQVQSYADDIKTLKAKYGVSLLFSVEDLGFLNKEDLCMFLALKPISTTLTWHNKNQFAGGDMTNSGLTKQGKEIVEILEKNNIFVDTAHLSRKGFWQFAKITTNPIYNSHSNINSMHKHNRNLTDKQIKKIVETNGYLGLTIYDEFILGKRVSSLDVAKQFDYLIKKFGYLNFGFGTDFFGINKNNLPKDILNYLDLQNKVKKHLQDMGYSNTIIEHIMHKNFKSFLLRQKLIKD